MSTSVGGGSEASWLSSFNRSSVAIGAGLFFSPMKVQHFRARCLDSDLQEGVRGVVQDFTLIIASIRRLAVHSLYHRKAVRSSCVDELWFYLIFKKRRKASAMISIQIECRFAAVKLIFTKTFMFRHLCSLRSFDNVL